ncbi:MAG TPA: tRNA (N6-threonylcarbamoyladenosine(37)-N6)-methyltransferase TrmO [Candidatus Marinimicrobia bacterium]|nr:tRNA (N6-threonylcarbamoyladenosine(37)-N6)-methyltransferase TrmO [Candidatus Neomarinimicrobiota bacterium]
MEICYRPIGVIHSPFREIAKVPGLPITAKGVEAQIELKARFQEGLQDLEAFSHLILIYHFHLAEGKKLLIRSLWDDDEHGIFASRSTLRPNPIGISVVQLVGVEENLIFIRDCDIADGTPLLDIKPYLTEYDAHATRSQGWLKDFQKKAMKKKKN